MDDGFVAEVGEVIRNYDHAQLLTKRAAMNWPCVQGRAASLTTGVEALRHVIRQACDRVGQRFPDEIKILVARYIDGQELDDVLVQHNVHEATFYRIRNRLIPELAIEIAAENRRVRRSTLYGHFFSTPQTFGTTAALQKLVAELRTPQGAPLLLLEGMGGLGKTTLARLIGQTFAYDEQFDGLLWVSAQQVMFDQWSGQQRETQRTRVTVSDVARELASQLEIEVPGDYQTLHAEVRTRCQQRPYLIFLDNIETIAYMEALVPLLEAIAGRSRVVITAREHLSAALPVALQRYHFRVDELQPTDAYQLLRHAGEQLQASMLVRASDYDLAQIFAVTGGNPLALWLVAGQAWGHGWDDFIQDLVSGCPPGSQGYELYDYLT